MIHAIHLEGLQKRYGDFTAVHGLDLVVRPSEIFGFLSPNGAEKTATIKMWMGILTTCKGKGTTHGKDIISDRVELEKIMGHLPDSPTFLDCCFASWEACMVLWGSP